MRGRVACLLFSLLTLPAFPQCTFQKIASAQFRATYMDVYADGNDLWTATSYGVTLFDRSVDPPKIFASIAVPGVTRDVRAFAGLAYVASGSSIVLVRKNAKSLEIVRTIDTGATINDLLLTANQLYVATSAGLVQYDLLDRLNPAKSASVFSTTSANVLSLAIRNSTLFAVDGDSSVEAFDVTLPSSPQKLANITSLASARAAHVSNGRLYISDALQTEVFIPSGSQMVSAATALIPTLAFAQLSNDAFFAGGNDLRLRAFDLTTPSNTIEIFRDNVTASSGNTNRILGITTAGGHLYVAAGDAGLLTYDISGFTSPFAVRSFAASPSPSIVSTGDHVYISPSAGGLVEYNQNPSGQLTQARTWNGSTVSVVRDGGNGFLLTTSGANATMWALTATIPTAFSSVTFGTSVKAAVLNGTKVIAILTDGSLATADMALAAPAAQAVKIPNSTALDRIARSGIAEVISQINDNGTTTLYYFASSNVTTTPITMSVPGIVGSLALNGGVAAAFSFPGITLANFAAGTSSVIPQSNSAPARGLAYAGSVVVELTDSKINLWDATSKTLTKQLALTADPAAIHTADNSTIIDIATTTGITTVNLSSSSVLPISLSAPNGNAFYKKVAASADRVYLFDGHGVDIFTGALHYVGGIRAGGLVDVTANPRGFYTLNASALVTAYSRDGVVLAQSTVATGSDLQVLNMTTAGDAVWVSIEQGCLSGGCVERTLVLNPVTLAQTSQLPGGVVEATTNGNTAFAIFDLPAEVHRLDITNPLLPADLGGRLIEGTRTPVSLAFANNTVYVIGDKLYAYAPQSLANVSTQFETFTPVSGGNVYADQRVRADGNCTVLTARSFAPTLYTPTSPLWTPTGSFDSPSLVRNVATVPGTMYLLTDHSLEVWSTAPPTKPPRREAGRR